MKVEQARGWEITQEAGEEGGMPRGMPPSSPARASRDLRPVPEPEVKAQRRQFSAAYKLRILQEADSCKGSGEVTALLRREGLYFSHLSKWRKLRRLDTLDQMRGRKPDPDAELKQRIQELERENERLQGKLRQAAKIIEVQKKVSEILGGSLEETGSSDKLS
jgi:transposase-like protein